MAGGGKSRGRRRPNNNNKNKEVTRNSNRRRSSGRGGGGLFVEGGLLSDWSLPQQTPTTGRNPSLNNNNKKSGSKSGLKSGSDSKSGSRKSNVNAIGYHYPSPELQEGFNSRFRVKSGSEDENMDDSSPMVLVDLSDTKISAHADQTLASEPQSSMRAFT